MRVDELPFNPAPRRIWSSSTIPGKKMVKALGEQGLDAGRLLLELYKGEPHESLEAVAYALCEVRSGVGAFGPSARDLTKPIMPGPRLFGALFKDIRDFLKLRFRANGAISDEHSNPSAIIETIGQATNDDRFAEPGFLVNYVIFALDGLSRSQTTYDSAEFHSAVRSVRDLCWLGAKAWDPSPDWINSRRWFVR
jgi:hypothetical protein